MACCWPRQRLFWKGYSAEKVRGVDAFLLAWPVGVVVEWLVGVVVGVAAGDTGSCHESHRLP